LAKHPSKSSKNASPMLKQRIITAVLLLAVFLPALVHPSPGFFAGLTLVLIAAAGWEWARMQGALAVLSAASGVAAALVLSVLMWGELDLPWSLVLISVWMLARGVSAWGRWPQSMRHVLGLVLIVLAGAALWQARLQGWVFLLSILILVWTADVAAYFGGKRWGRRKLAPLVSPGKTWAGAFSGLAGVLLVSSLWLLLESMNPASSPSLFARLWLLGPVLALLALVFLTAMAVVGDLVESLVKRSAGIKDSSGLLPGHGGVLDRVDALLPVLPLAMMLVSR
jgi:phosphatidate cytidylyltransferase